MIVLDTHIWVNWILLGEISLPRPILAAMDSQSSMAISAISCFEVSLLVKQGILELPLPVTNGFQKCSLDRVSYARRLHARQRSSRSRSSTHTKDPADRIIIATAIVHDALLASIDSVFPAYPEIIGRLIAR